ncbi:MAG: T9SS type A sorting domain-containing protein, partial [Candidatus Hydrothermia bacterium]
FSICIRLWGESGSGIQEYRVGLIHPSFIERVSGSDTVIRLSVGDTVVLQYKLRASLPGAARVMAYAKKEGQGGPAGFPGDMTPPFALYAPYPNPAKGRMTIQFSVPTGANTSLALYDIMGRRVSTLYNGKEPGLHNSNPSRSSLAFSALPPRSSSKFPNL